LKESKKQFLSAKKQITSRKEFLEKELNLFVPCRKVIIFNERIYETHIYDFDSKKDIIFLQKNILSKNIRFEIFRSNNSF
jgi:hypothetical protein